MKKLTLFLLLLPALIFAQNPNQPLAGKKIIWVGTSIPANYGTSSYPNQLGKFLSANMDNESVGSSGIIWDGTRNLSLSATKAELHSKFPGSENQSYEAKLIGKNADIVVFDHGHNDREQAVKKLGDINSTDRTTFYGAFNYVINKLYDDNPDVRIVFIVPPNRYTHSGSSTEQANMDAVRKALFQLAYKYGAPICDLMELCNFNLRTVKVLTLDGIHPKNGEVTTRIAIVLFHFFGGISYNEKPAKREAIDSLPITKLNNKYEIYRV